MKLKKFIITPLLICSLSTMVFAAPADRGTQKREFDENFQTSYNYDEVTIEDQDESFLIEYEEEILFESKKVSETVYVTASGLNVRTVPTTESQRWNIIYKNTEITRVGYSDCGWDIIEIGEDKFFVWGEYLTMEKPEEIIELEVLEKEEIPEYESYDNESTYNVKDLYSPSEFQVLGVLYWRGWRWTWYSERVLPGGGLNIPGRYTDSLGYVRDENGYLCLASSVLDKGTIVETPLGSLGKVYDSGCPADVIDVYVGW